MKKMKITLLFLLIFLFTGCYNYRELNDLAIVSALAIDKIDDKYIVSVQVINIQKTSNGTSDTNNPKFIIYSHEGKTIQEAIRLIINESPKRIYANHADLVVLSENVCKEGIYNILDIFIRDTESRKQFSFVIARNIDAKSIISTVSSDELLNSTNIYDSLETNNRYIGSIINLTYEEIVNLYLNKRTEIIMPSVEMIKSNDNYNSIENTKLSEAKNKVVISTMGYFKDDKLIDYLSFSESLALSFILDKIKTTIITIPCEKNKYVTLELAGVQTKTNFDRNNININIQSNSLISEINCDIDIEKNENINKIEKIINNEISNQIDNLITRMKTENIDIFSFKDSIYKNNPKFFLNNRIELIDLNTNIITKVKINRKGNIIKVIKK